MMRVISLFLSLSLIFSPLAYSQEQAVDPQFFSTDNISPEAEKNFIRGLEAAKSSDWSLASGYFLEAQKKAPFYAPLLFNLGLASSKAGNDATAMAWFAAYLAASPNAENAAVVRQEMTKLKAVMKDKSARIYQSAFQAAEQIPKDTSEYGTAIKNIAETQAGFGDYEAAFQTMKKSDPKFDQSQSDLHLAYVKTLARLGDFNQAAKIIEQGPRSTTNKENDFWLYLAERKMAQGDLASAWKFCRKGSEAWSYESTARDILDRKVKEGDWVFVEQILKTKPQSAALNFPIAIQRAKEGNPAEVNRIVSGLATASDKGYVLTYAAKEFWIRKDYATAKELANQIIALADQLDKYSDDELILAIAMAGNYSKALGMVAKLEVSNFFPTKRIGTYAELAYLKTLAGDEQSARKAEELSAKETIGFSQRAMPQHFIALAFIDLGKLDKAVKEAAKLTSGDDNDRRVDILARVASAQAKAGDFASAEASLKSAGYDSVTRDEPQFEARQLISQEYQQRKDIAAAVRIYDGMLSWYENKMAKSTSVWSARSLEKVLAAQAEIYAQAAGVKKELAEWAKAARFLSSTFNTEEVLAKAKNPYDKAPAEMIIADTAAVAKQLRVMLVKFEQMEKGNFDGALAEFVAED
jgi:tetratricopeptide (TPR) repeat protein